MILKSVNLLGMICRIASGGKSADQPSSTATKSEGKGLERSNPAAHTRRVHQPCAARHGADVQRKAVASKWTKWKPVVWGWTQAVQSHKLTDRGLPVPARGHKIMNPPSLTPISEEGKSWILWLGPHWSIQKDRDWWYLLTAGLPTWTIFISSPDSRGWSWYTNHSWMSFCIALPKWNNILGKYRGKVSPVTLMLPWCDLDATLVQP